MIDTYETIPYKLYFGYETMPYKLYFGDQQSCMLRYWFASSQHVTICKFSP